LEQKISRLFISTNKIEEPLELIHFKNSSYEITKAEYLNNEEIPWHDIAACVFGSAAQDIAKHFIECWNYVKMKNCCNSSEYLNIESYKNNTIPRHLFAQSSSCNVQTLRSVSHWSAGVKKTESSIHKAMKHLILTAEHYIYIENQFFISSAQNDLIVKNEIAVCLFNRIVQAYRANESFKVYICIPLKSEG
jgi:phospholipase D1/2